MTMQNTEYNLPSIARAWPSKSIKTFGYGCIEKLEYKWNKQRGNLYSKSMGKQKLISSTLLQHHKKWVNGFVYLQKEK